MNKYIMAFVLGIMPLFYKGLNGKIYEGFDFSAGDGDPLGSSDAARSGQSSGGWHSTWQAMAGKSLVQAADLEISGLKSSKGSLGIRGSRKERSIGQGVAMRQIAAGHSGDVYGGFRFRPGKLIRESAVGLLIALPGDEAATPRNATFAFCPKRWGSPYGLLGAGERRLEKIESGVACQPGEIYLVLWKLENLPAAGKSCNITLRMWVLNEAQAAYFAMQGFSAARLDQAGSGADPGEVCQSARRTIRDSRRGLFRGMVVSCFSVGVPRVTFDEIHLSQSGFAQVVGLPEAKR